MPGVAVAQSMCVHQEINQQPKEKRQVLQKLLDLQENYKCASGNRLMVTVYPLVIALFLLINSSRFGFIPVAIAGGVLLWKIGTGWVKKAKKAIEEVYTKYPEEVKILKECYHKCTL